MFIPRKNKHLTFKERHLNEIRLKDSLTPYKIAKELKCTINTILNEIKRGTTTQIKQGQKVEMYLADTGETFYPNNRLNSFRTIKRLECSSFINQTVDIMQNHYWLPDVCYGEAFETGRFTRSEMYRVY